MCLRHREGLSVYRTLYDFHIGRGFHIVYRRLYDLDLRWGCQSIGAI